MMHLRRPTLLTVAASAALTLAAAAPASAASSVVAVWNMGDTGSTMRDASGNGHDGTLHDVDTGKRGYTSTGKAFGFSGSPSYVKVPDSSRLNPGSSSFSFTLHAKYSSRPSSSVGDYDVLRKGLSTSDGGSYKLEILQSGVAFCDFRGSKDGSVSSSKAPSTGSWHTITCARTPTSVSVTVDGTTRTKQVSTGSISNSGSLYIGARGSDGGDQYEGSIDAVTVRKG